jgi:List-Bact-rpt repeat protein
MATSQTVVATFTLAPTLTVNKTGSGNGTVMSSPAGINCGSDCSQSYAQGTVVTLTASPNGNSNFTGWSAPCAGTGSCVVTLIANTTVGAQFTSK